MTCKREQRNYKIILHIIRRTYTFQTLVVYECKDPTTKQLSFNAYHHQQSFATPQLTFVIIQQKPFTHLLWSPLAELSPNSMHY